MWPSSMHPSRSFASTLGLLLAVLAGTPAALLAQGESETHLLVGLTLAAYRTTHPEGGPMSLGGLLAFQRRLSDHFSVRAAATVSRGVARGDGISICHFQPDGSCLPDAVFPSWLSTLEIQGVAAPIHGVPVYIVLGGGFALANDARENRRSAPSLPLSAERQAIWRGGLEVPFGSSRRAPRIQLTRTGFASAPFSLSFVDGLTFVVRP